MNIDDEDRETADERADYLRVLEARRTRRDDARRRRRYLDALVHHLWVRMLERAWM